MRTAQIPGAVWGRVASKGTSVRVVAGRGLSRLLSRLSTLVALTRPASILPHSSSMKRVKCPVVNVNKQQEHLRE